MQVSQIMKHTLSVIAQSRKLDPLEFKEFALANEDKYGILTDGSEPEVGTWHVDQLVCDFRSLQAKAAEDFESKPSQKEGQVKPGDDGWVGIGTFGDVGPCDTLRKAMIRSGI
jgi:hypothetical protein